MESHNLSRVTPGALVEVEELVTEGATAKCCTWRMSCTVEAAIFEVQVYVQGRFPPYEHLAILLNTDIQCRRKRVAAEVLHCQKSRFFG